MQPGYGTPVLVGYGNGASSGGSLPAINEALSAIPRGQMSPPTLTTVPRMPIIERITPRHINAGKLWNMTAANARVKVITTLQRLGNVGKGYANVTRTRLGV